MTVNLTFLFRKKHDVKIGFRGFKIHGGVLKNIYGVGLPSIVMQSIGSVMLVGLNAILIKFSDAAVAVLGIYFRLQSFIFMPVFGLTQGSLPIFGYITGQKQGQADPGIQDGAEDCVDHYDGECFCSRYFQFLC
jgi:Na+-driven multidrug efflux pump